jgi:hypothetical protein
MFDEELYEAEFYGADVQRIKKIEYRISVDGVQELKRSRWDGFHHSVSDLDPAMVQAAKRARAGDGNADDVPFSSSGTSSTA